VFSHIPEGEKNWIQNIFKNLFMSRVTECDPHIISSIIFLYTWYHQYFYTARALDDDHVGSELLVEFEIKKKFQRW